MRAHGYRRAARSLGSAPGLFNRRPEMKRYLIAAALAALAASSALAATHRNVMRNDSAAAAYDYVSQPGAVVDHGKVIGVDPDPAIRAQLLREGDHETINGGQ
jgi:hypothetical protein